MNYLQDLLLALPKALLAPLLPWVLQVLCRVRIMTPVESSWVKSGKILVTGKYWFLFGLRFVVLRYEGNRFWPQGKPRFDSTQHTWEKDVWIPGGAIDGARICVAVYEEALEYLWEHYYRLGKEKKNGWEPIIFNSLPKELSVLHTVRVFPMKCNQIRFDFLPKSPLENGWRIAYENQKGHPTYSIPDHEEMKGGLTLRVDQTFGMDRLVEGESTLSRHIRFSANYVGRDIETRTGIYAILVVRKADRSQEKSVYLSFQLGSKPPERQRDGSVEWTVYQEGTLLPQQGWRMFDFALPEEFHRTFGQDGWELISLKGIRLRGNLSISPILLFQDGTQS